MPTVTLKPGERIRVEFAETDGAFDIIFSMQEIKVISDLPGSHIGNEGLIYHEVFVDCTCNHTEASVLLGRSQIDPKCPTHGVLAKLAAEES